MLTYNARKALELPVCGLVLDLITSLVSCICLFSQDGSMNLEHRFCPHLYFCLYYTITKTQVCFGWEVVQDLPLESLIGIHIGF